MGFFGLSEMLILFAVAGGVADAGDVKLTAPRDSADKAIRWVLPEADVVVHVNVEASILNVFGLLEEIADLKAAKENPEISQAIASAKAKMEEGLQFVGKEVELDFARDLGTFTLSLGLAKKEEMSLMIRMRGNFKGSKLQATLTKDAPASYEFKGKTIHRLKEEPIFKDTVLTFPDETTLFMGPKHLVEEALVAGRVKPVKGSRSARLAKLVDRRMVTFAMLALPAWVLDEVSQDDDAKLVAALLGDVDYIFYGAGPKRGVLEAGVTSKDARRQMSYLFKAGAAFLDAVRGLVDAGAYSILGVIPLIPPSEIDPAWQKALSDEAAVLEVAGWFEKRFTGKSKVKVDPRKQTVRLELDNPAALCGAVAPMLAGAGYWMYMRPFQDPGPMHEEQFEYEPERRPAIEYIPIP